MNDERPEMTHKTVVDDDFISLADLVRMVWKHRRKILLVSGLLTLVVAAITLAAPRPYEASAIMEVMPEYGQTDVLTRTCLRLLFLLILKQPNRL